MKKTEEWLKECQESECPLWLNNDQKFYCMWVKALNNVASDEDPSMLNDAQ